MCTFLPLDVGAFTLQRVPFNDLSKFLRKKRLQLVSLINITFCIFHTISELQYKGFIFVALFSYQFEIFYSCISNTLQETEEDYAVNSDNSEEQPKSRGVKRGTNRGKYKRNSYEKKLLMRLKMLMEIGEQRQNPRKYQ